MLTSSPRARTRPARHCLYCSTLVEESSHRRDTVCGPCRAGRRRHEAGLHAYTVATPVWLDRPTAARPGTPEKLDVLIRRSELGLHLWHPGDAGVDLC